MAIVTEKATGRVYTGEEARAILHARGIHYEYWEVTSLPEDIRTRYDLDKATQEADILRHFRPELDRLSAERGYRARDLIILSPATENLETMLVNFVREHHHTEDEVRFIVDGEGIFTVQRDGQWYDILVRAGDVIAVPAGTRHWFTLTDLRHVKAVRLFTDPAGWVAIYDPPTEVTA
jgi:1,2-dihydroxy-3-keto-5-methylthiopentene dioxygenase